MTINCKGTLIDLSNPKIMGILNCTPDSFFDGGRYKDEKSVLAQVEKMLLEGATFIDIGAYSSRPGAADVSQELELKRIVPIVELVLKNFPETYISIDTFRSKVAYECVQGGAAIINDISAGSRDSDLIKTVAALKVPYILMHMRGNPKTMHEKTNYDDLIEDLLLFFSEKIKIARDHGIVDVILDPGFGFAKTLEQNYLLLNKLESLTITDCPLLVGLSRKSMIYKLLNTTAANALNGTTALHMVALHNKANIIRTHDVKEAMECVLLHQQLRD